MHVIKITDDFSPTSAKCVKLTCDCGWLEKSYIFESMSKATTHFEHNHGRKGVILYKGERKVVNRGMVTTTH